MIEITSNRPSPTTFAVAVGAAMLSGQTQYTHRTEAYEIVQVRGTYSPFIEGISSRATPVENFAHQIASMYKAFAKKQERLGKDFEDAIFSDVSSLYES